MKPADLLALLQEFHRDKLALFRRHQRGARSVSGYEFNNTYQYILAREDTHLEWLRASIQELSGVPDEPAVVPELPPGSKAEAARAILDEDAASAAEFVARWRPRLADLTHARDRRMLELIVGEVGEHQRFFAQAGAGDLDLLGKRQGKGTGGGVSASRWVE